MKEVRPPCPVLTSAIVGGDCRTINRASVRFNAATRALLGSKGSSPDASQSRASAALSRLALSVTLTAGPPGAVAPLSVVDSESRVDS